MATGIRTGNPLGSIRKLALIIGINKYEHCAELQHSENDANDMASTLERVGFVVTLKVNLKRAKMKHVLNDFAESINSSDVVLFYFSGLGIQWEDQNYLIPKDASILIGEDINKNTINAQDILNSLCDRKPYITIFLLDCCRNHYIRDTVANCTKPLGLKAMQRAGSLIAFACAPGTIAIEEKGQRNGLFTKHLLKHITSTNEDIEMIFREVTNGVIEESKSKQVPFMSSSLFQKNIYLSNQLQTQQYQLVVQDICANAQWSHNASTVAGGCEHGSATNQLYYPYGLYLVDDQTIIIADSYNDRIVQWKKGDANGRVVAGGHGKGDRLDQLNEPTDAIIDKQADSLIICDRGNRRVVRWSRLSGTVQGEVLIENIDCFGLTMDDQRNLYVSDTGKHEVRRYQIGDNEGTLVAGGNGKGSDLNQLNWPRFIFVDHQQTIYVSDNNNHRVMKWYKGANKGIVVAGGQNEGDALTQLSHPNGVFVDISGTVYVADSWNNRILRCPQGARQATVIAGGNGFGDGANQFKNLRGLSFDRLGNLYVADYQNHRVQLFLVDESQSHCVLS